MTDTHYTIVCVTTGSTTVTSIINTIGIIGIIVAMAISNQLSKSSILELGTSIKIINIRRQESGYEAIM